MKVIPILMALFVFLLAGCMDNSRKNDKLRYANDSGLPTNCRALIKANIDGVKSGQYTASESLASIDRNCGENGRLWRAD